MIRRRTPMQDFVRIVVAFLVAGGVTGSVAQAQSSSLWAASSSESRPETALAVPASSAVATADQTPQGSPALAAYSYIAVPRPKPKKMRKHDIITVIVNEAKRSQVRSSAGQEKQFEVDSSIEQWLRIHDSKLVPSRFRGGQPGIALNFDQQWEGDGEVRRDERLVTRVPAKVVDVKPNGNLVIAGRKYIKEDEEERIMTLTGECRSADVLPDNTILSTQVAELVIDTKSTGAVRDASRRGWIPRAFDLLRPF